ncbi:MAG: hypothetical protein NXI14_01120 [bacterium]|nr:hypothetical protein [bacterium]
MSEVATKVCRFCEKDVSGEARIKDKKGRYACQPCFERLKAKRAQTHQIPEPKANPYSAFAPDIDTDAISIETDAASAGVGQQPMRPCPSCKAMMGAADVFCVQCGTNVQTGGKLGKAKVKKAKPRRERPANLGATIGTVVSLLIAGSIGVGLFIGSRPDSAPAVAGISIAAFLFYAGVVGIMTLVDAFRQGGFVKMLLVWFVPFYVLFWMYGQAESAMLKLNFTLTLVLYVPYFMALARVSGMSP